MKSTFLTKSIELSTGLLVQVNFQVDWSMSTYDGQTYKVWIEDVRIDSVLAFRDLTDQENICLENQIYNFITPMSESELEDAGEPVEHLPNYFGEHFSDRQ